MSNEKYYADSDMKSIVRPLFIQKKEDPFSHTANSENASVFFFRLENHVYACTCKHVIKTANSFENVYLKKESKTLRLKYPIKPSSSTISNNGFHFAYSEDDSNIDLAFLCIKGTLLEAIEESHYTILELDETEPNIENFSNFYAYGWSHDEKTETMKEVKTPLIRCNFLPSNLSHYPYDYKLSFHADLKTEHNLYLSGMSGGLILGCSESSEKLVPVGIIYQGAPTKKGVDEKQDTFLNMSNSIHILGYKISSKFLKMCLKNYDISYFSEET